MKTLIVVGMILLVAGLAAYIWWWNTHGDGKLQRERDLQEAERRAVRVRMAGWRYDDESRGDSRYRIHGTTPGGLEWEIDYDTDHGSSSSTPKLIFKVEALTTEAFEWQIMDRWSYDFVRKGVGKAVVGGLAALASVMSKTMSVKTDFFNNAKEQQAGSMLFRERFALIALQTRYAGLINAEIERAILDWPEFKQSMSKKDNCFSSGCGPDGMRVQLYVDGPGFEVIEHMVRLGEALADRSQALRRGML